MGGPSVGLRYGSDPRTVDKLFDGRNHTCDDLHAWLAPYTRGTVGPMLSVLPPRCALC